MKSLALCTLLLTAGAGLATAFDASLLEEKLTQSSEQATASKVCCLPVVEKTTKGDIGFCYISEAGYLQARIDDQQLRDHANSLYPQKRKDDKFPPTCQDPWCTFSKGPGNKRYFRTDGDGLVLQEKDKKFEKDNVGLLLNIRPGMHVADYGLKWTGDTDVPKCEVDVDKNVELLGPLCVMKIEGDKKLSFVDPNQVREALRALANKEGGYMLFYKTEGPMPNVTGVMPSQYLKALFDSKASVKVGACSGSGLYNTNDFEELGFQIVE